MVVILDYSQPDEVIIIAMTTLSKAELIHKLQWIESYGNRYTFWAPIIGLTVGAGLAYMFWRINKTAKRKVVLDKSCLVCYNNPCNLVILPCKHLIICAECFQQMDRCPLCRKEIEQVKKLEDFLH